MAHTLASSSSGVRPGGAQAAPAPPRGPQQRARARRQSGCRRCTYGQGCAAKYPSGRTKLRNAMPPLNISHRHGGAAPIFCNCGEPVEGRQARPGRPSGHRQQTAGDVQSAPAAPRERNPRATKSAVMLCASIMAATNAAVSSESRRRPLASSECAGRPKEPGRQHGAMPSPSPFVEHSEKVGCERVASGHGRGRVLARGILQRLCHCPANGARTHRRPRRPPPVSA